MINRVTYDKLQEKLEFFLKYKIPYKKITTHGRTLIITEDWESWENKESRFPAKELHFIKSVKDYVIKHKTYQTVRNYFGKAGKVGANKKIKYFHYNKDVAPGNYFEGCYEVDIKNCYWDTAFVHYNLFDQALYEKGLTVSKKSRLAAIGSLAKVKSITVFDGKKEEKMPDIRSKKTEYLWHTICNKIGQTMFKGSKIAKDDFLFFWVDGIFLKDKTSVKQLQKFLKQAGYESSVSYCEWVKFEEKGLTVKSKAKGKWVTKIEKVPFIRKDGKKCIRKHKKRVWVDERPFPYARAIEEKDILNLHE